MIMALATRPLVDRLLHAPVALKSGDSERQHGYVVDTYPDSEWVLVEWLEDDGTTSLELERRRVTELLLREDS